MEPELALRLRHIDKEHLALILQELVAHHPILLTELGELLERYTRTPSQELELTDDDVTEDWDFSGNELTPIHASGPLTLPTFDVTAYQQRLKAYPPDDAEAPAAPDDLSVMLEEAQMRADQHDYQHAIQLYSLLVDERLAETNDARAQLFDHAIDTHLIELETLLSEASSNILFDAHTTFSPLLSPEMRVEWLKRLFALWLKRLDARRQEEHIPEIILNVAWSDDLSLLHQLVTAELQQSASHTHMHANIVNLQQEYRTRTLEKFLKELPRP